MSSRKGPVEILVSGRFITFRGDGTTAVTDPVLLAQLDGYQVVSGPMSAHLHAPLNQIVFGGELSFVHQPGDAQLTGVTRYVAKRPLKPNELSALVRETQGQWSDGVGESLFASLAGEEVILSARVEEPTSEQRHVPGLKVPKESPIFAAIKAGKLARVRTLAEAGHLTTWDRWGTSPLQAAINGQKTAVALTLVELDPHAAERRKELILAARMGQLPVVKALLAAGVPANACEAVFPDPDPHGRITALMTAANGAAAFRDLPTAQETIASLLGAGADPNLASPDSGQTPLYWARDAALVTQLLEAGADPTHRCARGQTPVEYHVSQRESLLSAGDPEAAAKRASVIAAFG